MKALTPDVDIAGPRRVLKDRAVTVYEVGWETVRLRAEAAEALQDGPVMLALLSGRQLRRTPTLDQFNGPFESRLAIQYPDPVLSRLNRQLLAAALGEPLPSSAVQRDVLSDVGSRRGERPFATPRERELTALFGDHWRTAADPDSVQ